MVIFFLGLSVGFLIGFLIGGFLMRMKLEEARATRESREVRSE